MLGYLALFCHFVEIESYLGSTPLSGCWLVTTRSAFFGRESQSKPLFATANLGGEGILDPRHISIQATPKMMSTSSAMVETSLLPFPLKLNATKIEWQNSAAWNWMLL